MLSTQRAAIAASPVFEALWRTFRQPTRALPGAWGYSSCAGGGEAATSTRTYLSCRRKAAKGLPGASMAA